MLFFFLALQQLDARLYFLHIPKTAGTSLRLMLELQVSAGEIYPYRNQSKAKGAVTQELVSGHFSYEFCKRLDPNFEEAFKVTTLRDPVERYLSLLRFKKRVHPEFPDLESAMAARHSTNKRYRAGLIDNALCHNLAADPRLEGEALLESAKRTLQELDCVLFFENYTQDVVDLFRRLGVEVNEQDIPRINVTVKEPVSEALLEEVRQANQLDMELYKYAKTHLQKKNTEYPLRTQSFDALLKKSNSIDYSFDLPLNGRGWSYREKWPGTPIYRWIMSGPAYISFFLEEGVSYDLYFTAQPLTDEVSPKVSVNGREIEVRKLNNELFSLYYGEIPREYITADSTEISFHSPLAFRYVDPRNIRDATPLSFAVSRITIMPSQ